ncbi:MAG: tyrosinase family protein [Actinomycetota bacterium]
MAATRRDITTNATDAQNFVDGVMALKAIDSGFSTADLGLQSEVGGPRQLSRWDLYPIWHYFAMQQERTTQFRNAAHGGPVFLPWHRWFLLMLEFDIRRALGLGRDDFGLPYWNWAADGTGFTPARQATEPQVWGIVNGDGQDGNGNLLTGPFSQADGFRVVVRQGAFGLIATDRPLRRSFRNAGAVLPDQDDVDRALAETAYDTAPFDETSEDSFRNLVEGWRPFTSQPSQMHNRVHVWVGGDMGPGTSPNDPVFFLNHCFIDKLWQDFQDNPASGPYLPQGTSAPGDDLFRHREGDPLVSLLTTAQPSVAAMFDVSDFYTYV